MGAVAELILVGRATGTGVPDWLRAQLDDTYTQTDQQLGVKVIYVGFTPPSLPTADVTDANAEMRFVERDISAMAHNLSRLALAAKLIVPGLRDMTQTEKSALRHYYRGRYRKA